MQYRNNMYIHAEKDHVSKRYVTKSDIMSNSYYLSNSVLCSHIGDHERRVFIDSETGSHSERRTVVPCVRNVSKQTSLSSSLTEYITLTFNMMFQKHGAGTGL